VEPASRIAIQAILLQGSALGHQRSKAHLVTRHNPGNHWFIMSHVQGIATVAGGLRPLELLRRGLGTSPQSHTYGGWLLYS
jgi:hypothetical protein